MHETRNGSFCDIEARVDATWRWARYIGELDGDRVYVELEAGGGGRIKRRLGVKSDRIRWHYVERGNHPGCLPKFAEGPRSEEEKQNVSTWRKEGKSWKWIGEQLSVSDCTAKRRHPEAW